MTKARERLQKYRVVTYNDKRDTPKRMSRFVI